ncbi:Cwh43p Ecym_1346 [Eremothecium cymbalariae DBVPG|uniref:Calcofluor white hypersensitive protein n=1 Tax=Eremothecium cymbalariae (strain CBS 270.75 / DBVPG 7215 / KCTC 17166 / NRRL Y-17582) TaxID=931890 RepID=G8JNB6_ERECY|nr:hypothetical protein Ecym_1346 [Eremothecium cymbalariae DBVPG\
MVSISGKSIVWLHTVCASGAFVVALLLGYNLHFDKIVRNAHYGYPDEWFPSVSATIGDRYPERSVFQIAIALTAMPRFLLLLLHWFKTRSLWGPIVGVLRTVTCGGWVYITSTDDHNVHDVFMISYIFLTIPWDVFVLSHAEWKKPLRIVVALSFFGTLIPLVYWFIEHNFKVRAGAYSIYAYFEWSLIILDVLFDGLSCKDMENITLTFADGISSAANQVSAPPKRRTRSDYQNMGKYENDSNVSVDESLEEINIVVEEQEDIIYAPLSSYIKQESVIYILVNVFDSFMFWTNLTSLLCIIWYFPLWYMGISGYEATIAAVLSPILLCIPFVPILVHQYGPLLGNVVGIGAYLIQHPETRLITVAVAVGLSTMNFVQTLRSISREPACVTQYAVAWSFGLVASVILKMAFYSNNPIWPIMNEENGGWNKTGLIVATVFAIFTPYINSCHYAVDANGENSAPSALQTPLTLRKKLLGSLGLGALIFSIHQLLTDSSTLIYWSWEGWSQSAQMGPLPWPFAALTCVVMSFAATSSWKFAHSTKSTPIWTLVLSTLVLGSKHITGWYKFILGGLPYAYSVLLFVPNYFITVNQVSNINFTASFVTYVILTLSHVWTVAYAFVPYGWVLRERLDCVLATASLLIVAGSNEYRETIHINSAYMKRLFLLLVGFIVAIAYVTEQLRPTGVPQPYHPDSELLTAGIWTVHFGLDNEMWASENRMIDLIRDMELDIVGLLETDTQRITMGNRDLTSRMAHELQMYADYGPGPNKHTWGCVLLSKFPIVQSEHHLLPSPVGELAPAIHAILDVYGELIDVYVFHSGQEEDELDRKLQSEGLRDLMGAHDRPAILLSYLVTEPHNGNYNNYVSDKSGMHDIDPEDDDRWCQYILFKNLKRTGFARVSRGTITDTELQVGKFQVHQEPNSHKAIKRLDKNEVEQDMRFPDKFLGEGERGHRYHVFEEPRYYD